MSSSSREELIKNLNTQLRYVTANSVIFSQAIADAVGIHPTDNECLDYLMLNGPATAGQLARLTGLTTGAITAVIDRLEKTGFVKREPHPEDRRKVIVVPNTDKIFAEIMPYAMPMGQAVDNVCAEFSAEELAVVLRFIEKANAASVDVITSMRQAGKK